MAMVRLRKDQEGDAAGRLEDGTPWSFEWPQDGAVVEVPYEVALDLLAIPHAGYSVAEEAPSGAWTDVQARIDDGTLDDHGALTEVPDEADREVEEPAPAEGELSESPAPRKRAAAKKTAAKAPVEE